MNRQLQLKFCAWMFAALIIVPSYAVAWNISTHMVHGAMTSQILRQENPSTIAAVRLILKHHPWQERLWRGQLEKLLQAERDEMLFMLVARWADDIRTQDREQDRARWHYINFPFKPADELQSIEIKPPARRNILTAMAENKRLVRTATEPEKRAVALAWLFHIIGDVHQPLHTTQLFSREYPQDDRGGNEMCIRVIADRAPLSLHRLWDGLLTSSQNVRTLRNMATELRSRFPKASLSELGSMEPEAWATESFEVAVKVAYQNGTIRGTPRGKKHKDCREVADAALLPAGYAAEARQVADRLIALAGYRLASFLERISRP